MYTWLKPNVWIEWKIKVFEFMQISRLTYLNALLDIMKMSDIIQLFWNPFTGCRVLSVWQTVRLVFRFEIWIDLFALLHVLPVDENLNCQSESRLLIRCSLLCFCKHWYLWWSTNPYHWMNIKGVECWFDIYVFCILQGYGSSDWMNILIIKVHNVDLIFICHVSY